MSDQEQQNQTEQEGEQQGDKAEGLSHFSRYGIIISASVCEALWQLAKQDGEREIVPLNQFVNVGVAVGMGLAGIGVTDSTNAEATQGARDAVVHGIDAALAATGKEGVDATIEAVRATARRNIALRFAMKGDSEEELHH